MKIKFISCWFATSYGAYTDALRQALERKLETEVGVISSNCGCGDPVGERREFQDNRCEYFEAPHVLYYKSSNPLKYRIRNLLRQINYRQRAKTYLSHSDDADILHMQQTLNAYGSVATFNWLRLPGRAARVVTVHELDPYQLDFPKSNLTYNRADRIIVHTQEMKDKLTDYGVSPRRIDVISHGTDVGPLAQGIRQGIIFYGGHKLHTGKGLDTLFEAMTIVRQQLLDKTPLLSIHGHYGEHTPAEGQQLAEQYKIADHVRWLNKLSLQDTVSEYQRTQLCVLPYTASFAGFPAVTALANGVPVIATRRAGLPEHLGDAALWVEENNANELAQAIVALLENTDKREQLATQGYARAQLRLTWDVIADQTLASYQAALANQASPSR
jgi:alpha-1,3-rhamnosyl/mannosyltransferase